MANAIMCDLCKQYYDLNFRENVIISLSTRYGTANGYIDICPDCCKILNIKLETKKLSYCEQLKNLLSSIISNKTIFKLESEIQRLELENYYLQQYKKAYKRLSGQSKNIMNDLLKQLDIERENEVIKAKSQYIIPK